MILVKIFINPGHCVGIEPGACGNGLEEAQVALNIGQRLENYLQSAGYVTKLFQYDGLAEIVDCQLLQKIETVDRSVKVRGFYLIKHTDAPAVLV